MYPSCPVEPSPQVNKALTLEPEPEPDKDTAVDRAASPDGGLHLRSDNDSDDGGATAAVRCSSAMDEAPQSRDIDDRR